MNNKNYKKTSGKSLSLGVLLAAALTVPGISNAQSYSAQNWVNDPFSPNANYTLTGGNTTSPLYTVTGAGFGSLFGNSPIGATLTLVNPGDSISFSGQVVLAGNVNTTPSVGNLQFRVGLYDDLGTSGTTDKGWMGYFGGDQLSSPFGGGLYLRNSGNTGVYASGTGATQVSGQPYSGNPTGAFGADTYNFSLTISLLTPSSTVVTWSLAATTLDYSYTVSYTDATPSTSGGLSFDQVGFLAGGTTFGGTASTADTIQFINPTITFAPVPEPSTVALCGLGLAGLVAMARRKK